MSDRKRAERRRAQKQGAVSSRAEPPTPEVTVRVGAEADAEMQSILGAELEELTPELIIELVDRGGYRSKIEELALFGYCYCRERNSFLGVVEDDPSALFEVTVDGKGGGEVRLHSFGYSR